METNLTPVQRRAIALVIADLLRTLDEQLGFLRPYTVIGCGPSMSTQPQVGFIYLCHRSRFFLIFMDFAARSLS
jgi:hypothetical protein